jgi:hypothetical protein
MPCPYPWSLRRRRQCRVPTPGVCGGDGNAVSLPQNNITRYQALPGNADPEALPPNFMAAIRARASGHRFLGSAWEPVILPASC